jgi:hypothetical protein
MSTPMPDDDDIAAELRADIPAEADEADAVEQRTPHDEAAPAAGGPPSLEADEGDLAESAQEVPLPDDEPAF